MEFLSSADNALEKHRHRISSLLFLLLVHKDQGLLSGLAPLANPIKQEEKCPVGLLTTVGFCHQI